MQWTYVSYAAGAIGVAAAAVAAPVLAPKLADLWSSARMATPITWSESVATRSKPIASPVNSGKELTPPPSTVALERPAFDVVRVDRTGEAVVAGHAAPDAKVELRDGGRGIAEIDADASGQFVILPPPLAEGAHRLELAARVGAGPFVLSDALSIDAGAPATAAPPRPVPSSPIVTVVEPTPAPARPAAAAPPSPIPATPVVAEARGAVVEPSPAPAPRVATVPPHPVPSTPIVAEARDEIVEPTRAPTPPIPSVPVVAEARETVVEPTPAPAPRIEARETGVTPRLTTVPPPTVAKEALEPAIVRSPVAAEPPASPALEAARPAAEPTPTVAAAPRPLAAAPKMAYAPTASKSRSVVVQSVEATREGRLLVRGAADPNATLHLYLNGSLLAAAAAGADRQWSLTIEHGMSEGDYVLRAEEVDPGGGVLARAEAPFTYPQHPSAAAPPLKSSAAPQISASAPERSENKGVDFRPTPMSVETDPPTPLVFGVAPAQAAKPAGAASPLATASASPPTNDAAAAERIATPLAPSPAVAAAAIDEPLKPAPSGPIEAPVEPPPIAPRPRVAVAPPEPLAPPYPSAKPRLLAPPAHVVVQNVETTTVVRGDNLWDLARHFYGDGARFRDLYAANASQIHKPRLIYVGQKFVVPKLATP
jgi:nucleoid-associated protein YgaU